MKRFLKPALSLVFTIVGSLSVWAETPANSSLQIKMTEFKMPPGYECPLFSNSPYTDMLLALDTMQDNLNRIFPECEAKADNEKAVQTSVQLRDKIMEAMRLQKAGQTYKLELTAKSIGDLATGLQKSIEVLSKVKTKSCYRSEAQFRHTIFAMNDTFQSLAPLVVDLVTKTPGLGLALGPAMKVLVGADAISKSLNMIEQIAKSSIQFDMTDKEQRMTTVKNICQFMKLYNRLEYLRMSRFDQIQTVHQKFQTEISKKNQKIAALKNLSNKPTSDLSARTGAQAAAMKFAKGATSDGPITVDKTELYDKLSEALPELQNNVQNLLSVFDTAKKEDNFSDITQCQAVTSTLKTPGLKEFKSNFEIFANAISDRSDYRLQLDVLAAYEVDIEAALKSGDRDRCARLGSDWVRKTDNLFGSIRGTIANYENKLIEEKGQDYVLAKKQIADKEAEAKAVQSNYANLKTMLNHVAFESSEVEKRAKGIHKYLFAGPDKVESDCKNRVGTECKGYEVLAGVLVAYFQEWRNQGPVFELILNNEKYFNDSFSKMNKAIVAIQKIEDENFNRLVKGEVNKAFIDNYPVRRSVPKKTDPAFKQYIEEREKNAFAMEHLNTKFLPKGSIQHTQACMNTRSLLSEYVIASTHMMSSVALCEMIKNVLGQPEVSQKLKNYCLRLSGKAASGVDQLRYRLIGEYDGTTPVRNGQMPLNFNRSPKAFVDRLLTKYSALECN